MNFIRSGFLMLALLLGPTIARADEADIEARKSQAQALSDEAFDEMEKKNYSSACPKLERAVEVFPEGSGAKKTLASCYEGSGRLATAYTQYELAAAHAIQMGRPDVAAEASKKAAELKPKLATLTIHVPDALRKLPGVAITRNGLPFGEASWETAVPVDVGEHVFAWKAPGYAALSEKVVVTADGTHAEVTIPAPVQKNVSPPLEAPAALSPRPWQKPLGITMLVTGGFGLGASGLLAGLAVGKKNESNDGGGCNAQNKCTDAGLELRRQAVGLGNGATAALIVGGVLAGSGLVLLLAAPSAKATPSNAAMVQWGFEIAPNRVGVQGVW
jgi:hypothetical protein